MIKPTVILLFTCYLLNIASSLHAETKKTLWYQVEAILFAQKEPNNMITTESWHKKPSMSWPKDMIILKWPTKIYASEQATKVLIDEIQLSPHIQSTNNQPLPSITNEPFTLLSSENLHLNSFASRIQRSSALRLLGHIGWRQPIHNKEVTRPVFIQAGDRYDLDSELEGTIQLIRSSNHLHIKAQLLFSKFISDNIINKGIDWSIFNSQKDSKEGNLNINSWRSSQYNLANNNDISHDYVKTRIVSIDSIERIILDKTVYFDNPLFGLVIKVSSFDPTLTIHPSNDNTPTQAE